MERLKNKKLPPIERITDNGDRSIVGMLDGDKDYFIKYVTDDELLVDKKQYI